MALTKIQTGSITDLAVTSAKINDKAVSLGKMADGTDGQVITWDSSAVITATGPGTATQVLTSNGAGAEPSFQAIVSDAAAMALALG